VPLFGTLTYQELNGLDRDETIVLVPTGCTEQQGPHLSVDFDTWFAAELCEAVGERLESRGLSALVLPTMPFGPTPEHRGYGGYIDLRQETFERLIEDVLHSLVAQRFSRLIIWRGCGGHHLAELRQRFNAANAGIARLWVPEHPYEKIWCSVADPSVPGGHADSFATSIALHRHPERVRPDRVPPPTPAAPSLDHAPADWSLAFPTGVVGDATRASAALGAQLWERTIDRVTAMIEALVHAEAPKTPRS
jgi:creatinine amidohydrolase